MSLRRYVLSGVVSSGIAMGGLAVAQSPPVQSTPAQSPPAQSPPAQSPPGQAAPRRGAAVVDAAVSQASSAQVAEAARNQRLGSRAGYFGDRARTQLEDWITRNKVTPYQADGARAPNAVAGRDAPLRAEATLRADAPTIRPATPAPAAVALPPAAATRVDVDTARGVVPPPQVARYGYSAAAAANAPDTWFYDYYNYSPSYYYGAVTSPGAYSGASRYHDFNQDGIYDAVTVVRNPAASGSFETYDRIDFMTSVEDRDVISPTDTIRSASRRTATGTIDRFKIVRVNGRDNLVVRVNTSINNPGTLADIGGVDRWPAGTIRDGDVVSVAGPVEEIGDRPIIISETVKLNTGPDVQIRRFAPAVEGTVVDVLQAEVLNSQHTLAVLDTGSSRQIVDLGPTDRLKFRVEPGVKIVVHGVPVKFQNYSVVLVDSVALDGQDIVIERWR